MENKFGYVNYDKSVYFASTKELIEENRIVAHPNDYIKLAECGAVCRLTRSGIKIIMSELASEGKIITTGALADALMKEECEWKE